MATTVIKIGGELAGCGDLLARLAGEIGLIRARSAYVMIHGGGAELTSLMRRMGLDPVFKDGIRMTAPEEMPFVDMVLSGQVNKRLVRIFQANGLDAVGLSGSDGRLFSGRCIEADTRTGEIARVRPDLARALLERGHVPVISSTSMDEETGLGLNINADSVAFALARALDAECLVFLSNIPGIMVDGRTLRRLTPADAEREIGSGAISGGMIPKVRASVEALEGGVSRIIIGAFTAETGLQALLDGRTGTQIIRGHAEQTRTEEVDR